MTMSREAMHSRIEKASQQAAKALDEAGVNQVVKDKAGAFCDTLVALAHTAADEWPEDTFQPDYVVSILVGTALPEAIRGYIQHEDRIMKEVINP